MSEIIGGVGIPEEDANHKSDHGEISEIFGDRFIPSDVAMRVFSFCDIRSRCLSISVCGKWKSVISNTSRLWVVCDFGIFSHQQQLSDSDVQRVIGFANKQLDSLTICNASTVKSEALLPLIQTNIKHLDIRGCASVGVTKALLPCPNLSSLCTLFIDGCNITAAELAVLKSKTECTIDVKECEICGMVQRPHAICCECNSCACGDCKGDFCGEMHCDLCDKGLCVDCFEENENGSFLADTCHECGIRVCFDCMSKKPMMNCANCFTAVCFEGDCMSKKPMMNCANCFTAVCFEGDCMSKMCECGYGEY